MRMKTQTRQFLHPTHIYLMFPQDEFHTSSDFKCQNTITTQLQKSDIHKQSTYMKVTCNTESFNSLFWCSKVGMTSFRTSFTFTDYKSFMSSLSLVFCWGHCRPATFRVTALYGGDATATCLTSCSRTTHLSSP